MRSTSLSNREGRGGMRRSGRCASRDAMACSMPSVDGASKGCVPVASS
jgi:hypothetical protein